jgi:flagellar motor switch protein FliM
MLEPIRAKLVAAFQSERLELDQHWMKRMVQQLEAVEMELSVDLGHTEITLQSLLDLQTGDIIRLDQDSDSEMVVRVEGIHKFMGLPRVMKQKKAVEITTRIVPPKEGEDE